MKVEFALILNWFLIKIIPYVQLLFKKDNFMSKLKLKLWVFCAFSAFLMSVNMVLGEGGESPLLLPQNASESKIFLELQKKATNKKKYPGFTLEERITDDLIEYWCAKTGYNVSDFSKFNGTLVDGYTFALLDLGFYPKAISSWSLEKRKGVFEFIRHCYIPDAMSLEWRVSSVEAHRWIATGKFLCGLGHWDLMNYPDLEEREKVIHKAEEKSKEMVKTIREALCLGSHHIKKISGDRAIISDDI